MYELVADCSRCFGLCCVVPAFAASTDFAIAKPARQPCSNLQGDSRCAIHLELRPRGFRGCAVYDCFGAGQQVSQETFNGRDWRTGSPAEMFDAFEVMRQLHELLWYLTEAQALGEVGTALAETEAMTQVSAKDLAQLDIAAQRDNINVLLRAVSEHARRDFTGLDRGGADLIGTDLRRIDLRGANLRGALLIGADLRGADLTRADVTGADLRDADLRGTDLRQTIFLHQSQLEAARGDSATRLAERYDRPSHW